MDKTAEDLKDRTKRFTIAFTARLGVVLEEADEGDDRQRGTLLAESRELVAIFSKA